MPSSPAILIETNKKGETRAARRCIGIDKDFLMRRVGGGCGGRAEQR